MLFFDDLYISCENVVCLGASCEEGVVRCVSRLYLNGCCVCQNRGNSSDTAGVLIAFMRTKNVIPAAVEFAIDKAYTSAILGKGTKEFGERMGSSVSLSLGVGTRSRLMTWTGGLPIFYKDNCVGGIGVSGAMDHQDLECAEAAISNLGLSSRAS